MGMGERLTAASKPGPGLGEGSGTLQDTAPSLFPGPPQVTCCAGPRQGGPLGACWDLPLTSLST